jgi:hypothetical protein
MLTLLSAALLPALVAVSAASGCSKASTGNPGSGGQGATSGGEGGTGGATGTGGAGGMSAGGGGGMGGAGGGGMKDCKTDGDCAKDPNGKVCDVDTGACVGCLPVDPPADDCTQGTYCNPNSHQCEVGCSSNFDCNVGKQACDTSTHKCVGCVIDTDCPNGSICLGDTCVPGCSGIQPCQAGFTCCGQTCYDLSADVNNCGVCNNACANPPGGKPFCDNGLCSLGKCNTGFADCDLNPTNGCEWNVLQDGPCACVPGSTQSCYFGAPGTVNVGACKAGIQTCNAQGTGWSDCVGQVLPKPEVCANNADDDCNGVVDDDADADGDGWTQCGGDCCDSIGPGCKTPKFSNPGAFEFPGNNQDDDCNPATPDSGDLPCSTAEKFTTVTGDDVAKAMDLCQFTVDNPPLKDKRWGVISAQQLLANGTTPTAAQLQTIQNNQTAILVDFGVVTPKKGPTMAGLSTGAMRDQDDPGYPNIYPPSTAYGVSSQPPTPYLLAHAGKLPASQGCSGSCPAGSGANDPVNVRLKIRVPTNAKSFSYSFKFYSSEYQSFQCQPYNDFFLALLQSNAPMLPADKNISFDANNNPVSVNNGFFDVCVPKGCNTCPAGNGDLAGTGLQVNNAGGATKWLITESPVVPAETMQLELMIFDVSDTLNDSYVLLDNFTWSPQDATVITHE